jgi:hypothetical protein
MTTALINIEMIGYQKQQIFYPRERVSSCRPFYRKDIWPTVLKEYPIWPEAHQIIEKISESNVSYICGGRGYGKSSVIPHLIAKNRNAFYRHKLLVVKPDDISVRMAVEYHRELDSLLSIGSLTSDKFQYGSHNKIVYIAAITE